MRGSSHWIARYALHSIDVSEMCLVRVGPFADRRALSTTGSVQTESDAVCEQLVGVGTVRYPSRELQVSKPFDCDHL